MCEAGLAEPRDIGVSPVVFGMAAAALTCAGRRHASVVAGLTSDILCYVFVAVETERSLPRAAGTVVAVGAISFDLGMRL